MSRQAQAVATMAANDATTSSHPVADRVRARLVDAGHRFHANDNISAFFPLRCIPPGRSAPGAHNLQEA